jgi:MFS family permease
MNAQTQTAIVAEPTRQEIRAAFVGLMIVMGLGAVDQSIVATALPRIVADLGGVTHLSWVVTSYVLTSTATMPLYGKLSDLYGRKPMIYVAVLIFLLGSMLSGAAQNLIQLIIYRAIQGIGAGGCCRSARSSSATWYPRPSAAAVKARSSPSSPFAACSARCWAG